MNSDYSTVCSICICSKYIWLKTIYKLKILNCFVSYFESTSYAVIFSARDSLGKCGRI